MWHQTLLIKYLNLYNSFNCSQMHTLGYDYFMIKRLLISQNGFSIIQGMLLASAVAGMAYVGTKLTTDQKLAQKGSESKGKVEQLHSMIYSIMQNKDHCTDTLKFGTTVVTPSGADHLLEIMTAGKTPVFKVNTAAGVGVYMNNAVSLNDISIFYPSDFSQHANLIVEYGKVDSNNNIARTGKGFGGKTIKKTIKIKIQTNPATNAFESCYAVDEAQNQNMVKDFCEGLRTDPGVANLFFWDEDHQKCVFQDTECNSNEIFAGFDSNGQRQCHAIKDWMNFGDLIDTTPIQCDSLSHPNKHFTIVGSQVRIQCDCYSTCQTAGFACNYSIPGCPGAKVMKNCGGTTVYCVNAGGGPFPPGCTPLCYW